MPAPCRFRLVACLSVLLAIGPAQLASAQFCAPTGGGGWHNAPSGTPGCVPLMPAPGGTPTGVLAANDDGSSSAIPLASAFPGGLTFFGGPYSQFWVNNNGNITFNRGVGTFTPHAFPVSSQPMIAPYWGDVDTRGGGTPGNNYVWWYLEPGRLIVTWHNVGYYSIRDDRKMDFQLILTNAAGCASGDFDVEFRYNRCEWTTGGASGGSGGFGGTPAQAGFDAGNGTDYVAITGSLTMSILDLCTGSNVGEPGVWRFGVHGGAVSCPGTGGQCDTGLEGACGIGVTQCIGGGVECVQVGMPGAERCDGVDNDCNGEVDDGDGLCSGANICYQGACVPPCFEGGCAEGQTCTGEGRCVDTACMGVTCESGQRCTAGTCVDACAGVTCPHDQQCVAGRCLAVCDVITCGEGEVCQDGACRPGCPCYPCPDGETCNADGTCRPTGCDLVTCDPGFYCEGGSCLDACDGATCPPGQVCQVGMCVDGMSVPPDAGVTPRPDGGSFPWADAGGSTLDGSTGGNGDGGRAHGPPPRPGCGCHAAVDGDAPSWLWSLGALAFIVRRRRR
jgi:MYXO-CTERM domain-containing protein